MVLGASSLLDMRIKAASFELACDNHGLDEAESGIEFNTCEADEDDISFIKDSLSGEGYAKSIDLALNDGCRVYVAKTERVIGFTVINPGFITLMNGCILRMLEPGQAYSFLSYVYPDYRGKKVFQRLKRDVYELLFSQGVETVFSIVDQDNIASIKAQKHLGVDVRAFILLADNKQVESALKGEKSFPVKARFVYDGQLLYHPLKLVWKLKNNAKNIFGKP